MPIKKPLQNIKKKLGLAPTFEKKRNALGVTREFNDTRTNNVGGMRVKADSRQANPKIRQIESLSSIQINGIENKIKELSAFKPKNEMEARKKKEALLKLNEKLNNAKIVKMDSISTIEIKRKKEREKRQEKIIENKLLSVLKSSPEYKRNASSLAKLETLPFKYTPSELRKSYQYFLKTSGKTFVELTINDIQKIFNSAVKNTKQ